jgi:hypothetical protein
MQTVILTQPKFAIIPQGPDAIWDADVEYFDDEESAYDAAYDWSVELAGRTVNVCRINHSGTYDVITQVWT